ncbi:Xenobiotic-transporting ATPase [Thalassoporum mexicanum PCC 7367]|uniref:ABC transporter ATP-binding protein n=1 Tax=Thalassoporum mexicanum TaxID=3457544 RepID=UPI00029FE492|nr:ABC transporter ATP-binding protein/permease [Pseudanabaena sp. PCC 7367]AFY68805.1 Xenobiotic-transporting ATPase [Pseudanabaena sp. PCC 7367]
MGGFISRLLYILKGQERQLVLLVLLFIFTSLLETVGIGLIGPFIAIASAPASIQQNDWSSGLYDSFQFSSTTQFISWFGLFVVCVLIVKSVLNFAVQRYIFGFGFGQEAQLRQKLIHAYLHVPYTFHLQRNTASLTQNIAIETPNFANGVLMPSLFSLANLTVVFSLLLLLLLTDFAATISIVILLSLLSLFLYQFKTMIARWGKQKSDSSEAMIKLVNHSLGGFKETAIIGCAPYFERKMAIEARQYKMANQNFNSFRILPRNILEPALVAYIVGFVVFSMLMERDTATLTSTLSVFAMASVRLLPAVSNLLGAFGNIRKHTYVVDKLYLDIREVETWANDHDQANLQANVSDRQSQSRSNQAQSLSFQRQITLANIVYTYPNAPEPAIADLSLTIRKGQSIGLIGKSGAGKTTLVDIILGLLQIDQGKFSIDGVDVYSNLRGWQDLVGYIPQSIFLIDDTIARNIAFGVPDAQVDWPRLEQAVQTAQLSELIAQLPHGLETNAGERGVLLSGGQRQRVGIARALYHGREVLILDEATAALDNETEALVTEAIKQLSSQRTVIIIAHRLSTVEHCDLICQMEQGRIVKSGSYSEVVLGEAPSSLPN